MHLFPKILATEPIIRSCIAYIIVGVLCSAHDTATGSNAPTTNYEQWFTAIIQNKPCGWLHITEIHTGDQIATIDNTQISVQKFADYFNTLGLQQQDINNEIIEIAF